MAVCQGLYEQDGFLVPKMAGKLWGQPLSLKNIGSRPGVTEG